MSEIEISGKGRILIRKSGYSKKTGKGGYEYVYLSIPNNIAKDSSFPFENKEDVNLTLKDAQLIVSKPNYLLDLISNYGIDNLTLSKLIENKARKNKDKPLILYKDQEFSYKEVHENSNQIANGILKINNKLNLKKGKIAKQTSKIALMLPNCPEFFFCWFGIVKSGYIFVPINRFLKGDDLLYILDHCDAEVLILDYSNIEEFEKIKEKISKMKKVFIKDAPDGFKYQGIYSPFRDLFSEDKSDPKVKTNFLDPMEVIYTEGTTGKPKGIIYRNLLIISGLIFSEEIKKYGEGNVVYCPTPLFQAFSQQVVVYSAIFYDAAIALAEKFDAETYWSDVKKYNADLIVYYGGILQALIDQPPSEIDRSHSAKWAVGGEAPKELWEVFENRFGVNLFEGWAPSEAVGFMLNTLGTKGGKKGSIGAPINGFDIKIVDILGNEIPTGPDHIGEIIVKMNLPFGGLPSNISLLQYYKTPENTMMKSGKDGFIHTGDMGYKDKDGFFYYVGRKVDVIRRHGKDIYAHVIENIANAHPSVLESAVFGVPGEDIDNEEIKICLVLKKNRNMTHQELLYYLSENLVYYLVPRFIEIKNLLRNSSERIKKYILKNEWRDPKVMGKTWDSMLKDFLK